MSEEVAVKIYMKTSLYKKIKASAKRNDHSISRELRHAIQRDYMAQAELRNEDEEIRTLIRKIANKVGVRIRNKKGG